MSKQISNVKTIFRRQNKFQTSNQISNLPESKTINEIKSPKTNSSDQDDQQLNKKLNTYIVKRGSEISFTPLKSQIRKTREYEELQFQQSICNYQFPILIFINLSTSILLKGFLRRHLFERLNTKARTDHPELKQPITKWWKRAVLDTLESQDPIVTKWYWYFTLKIQSFNKYFFLKKLTNTNKLPSSQSYNKAREMLYSKARELPQSPPIEYKRVPFPKMGFNLSQGFLMAPRILLQSYLRNFASRGSVRIINIITRTNRALHYCALIAHLQLLTPRAQLHPDSDIWCS